jgi:DNA-binding MurR/RpiR family transcriptional regulator
MLPLLKIRAERDQMSAIERRIADFILAEPHLLRDYSSQQLANALRISQSSVVKFSQKLGFKGYPDLKYSIGESIARGDDGDRENHEERASGDGRAAMAESLWHSKTLAEQETRLINPSTNVDAIAAAVRHAKQVYVFGTGEDGILSQAFAVRLSLLGFHAVHCSDTALMAISIATSKANDVLFAFSQYGQQSALSKIARQFRERRVKVVSVTRHTANPLRTQADLSLLVSAHDERPQIEPLLYQSALSHLLDMLFLILSESGNGRLATYAGNLERIDSLAKR